MDEKIDYSGLGGFAISKEVIDWILNNIPKGSTILELGSGVGTKELVKFYNVFSIEDDEEWLGFEPKTTYIHAPIVNEWYDVEILKNKIPKKYDLLLIDGPKGSKRENMIKHYDLFKKDVPVIIDDTNREIDYKLSEFLYKNFNKTNKFPFNCGNKEFTVII